MMTFDNITGDGRIWAVRYDGDTDNALYQLLDHWSDVIWLREFFKENASDLAGFYHIDDIDQAVEDTLDDSEQIEDRLLDMSPEENLDEFFHPLENFRTVEILLGKEKGRLKRVVRHSSWLRIYAIKLESDCYIITDGAIKLTFRMEERPHAKAELVKLDRVRNFLLSEGIIENDSFVDYVNTL